MNHLSDIAIFVRVVEAGSFTAAAAALGMSQSVVSRRVSALEKHLGVRLMQRTTRRLSLTEAGTSLFRRAQRSLSELADATQEVTQHQAEPRGTLRITAPVAFTLLHLTPLIGEFVTRYPQVRPELILDDRRVDIVDEGFDLAIRICELEDSNLVAVKLAPARHVVCGSPQYLARRGTPQSPDELIHHDCMVYTIGRTPGRWAFRRPGTRETLLVPVQGPMQSNNTLVSKAAALAGLGLVHLPTFYVGDELRAGALQPVLTKFVPQVHGVFAVYPQRRGLAPKVRVFVDFLKGRFGEPPYWDRDLPFLRSRGPD